MSCGPSGPNCWVSGSPWTKFLGADPDHSPNLGDEQRSGRGPRLGKVWRCCRSVPYTGFSHPPEKSNLLICVKLIFFFSIFGSPFVQFIALRRADAPRLFIPSSPLPDSLRASNQRYTPSGEPRSLWPNARRARGLEDTGPSLHMYTGGGRRIFSIHRSADRGLLPHPPSRWSGSLRAPSQRHTPLGEARGPYAR